MALTVHMQLCFNVKSVVPAKEVLAKESKSACTTSCGEQWDFTSPRNVHFQEMREHDLIKLLCSIEDEMLLLF